MLSVARLGVGGRGQVTRRFVICIVDDDEAVRNALARLMKAHGHIVWAFDSGESLMSSEHRAGADCLIADVQMGGMTGFELYEQLLASGFPTPTILITGHPEEAARQQALERGVACYLAKPFSEDELLECIHLAIEGAEAKDRPQ